MSMYKVAVSITLLTMVSVNLFPAANAAPVVNNRLPLALGTIPTADELARFLSVKPDGTGLPAGQGSYAQGQRLYNAQCAACHGMDLKGMPGRMAMPLEMAIMSSDQLIGGRGSLDSANPVFTVESHWPYATTLWDYIKRTMPMMAPGSLSDNDVYSLVAYILGEAAIIPKDQVIDARALPGVLMPNRNGFVTDPRPEPALQN